jgi:hypothetical protein
MWLLTTEKVLESFLLINLSYVQAEEARIAQEIQKKREKDGRDTELDKRKMIVS